MYSDPTTTNAVVVTPAMIDRVLRDHPGLASSIDSEIAKIARVRWFARNVSKEVWKCYDKGLRYYASFVPEFSSSTRAKKDDDMVGERQDRELPARKSCKRPRED